MPIDILNRVPEIAVVLACVGYIVKLFVDNYERLTKNGGTKAMSSPCKDHVTLITDVAIIKERVESMLNLLKDWESQSHSDLNALYDRMRFVESKIAVIESKKE